MYRSVFRCIQSKTQLYHLTIGCRVIKTVRTRAESNREADDKAQCGGIYRRLERVVQGFSPPLDLLR